MSARKTFAVYRYETWSERNPLRRFLGNANIRLSDGVTSGFERKVWNNINSHVPYRRCICCSRVGSAVIMSKKYRLHCPSPTNATGSLFKLLECLRVNLGVDFRTFHYLPPMNGASVFQNGVACIFQQQKEPLIVFSFWENLDDDIYGFSFPSPNDTLKSRHL